jgi:hypothetical protein
LADREVQCIHLATARHFCQASFVRQRLRVRLVIK